MFSKYYNAALKCRIGIVFVLFLLPQQIFAWSDVQPQSAYFSEINYLKDQGIVAGDAFYPNNTITKGDFVRWLLLLDGFNANTYIPKQQRSFIDVPEEHPLFPLVSFLVDIGAIRAPGADSYFKPDSFINKISALRLIHQIHGIQIPKLFDANQWQITNIKSSSLFAPDLHQAVQRRVIEPGIFYPFSRLTRAQAAGFIVRSKLAAPQITFTIGPSIEHEVINQPTFQLFTNAWDKISENYIHRTTVDKQELLYGAIEGLVQELDDPYSEFARPSNNALQAELAGEIEGIGTVIEMQDGEIIVISPLNNSPAEKAGILPGDVILSANGTELKDMALNEAVSLIKGPAGTQVTLIIRRATEKITFTITRAVIQLQSVDVEFTQDNIAMITMNSFNAKTSFEFIVALGKISNAKPKGIILDLRNNPGGFLDVAVEIAGYFISQGNTVAHIRYPTRMETQKSVGSGVLAKYPIIVIVNKGSASASEILAGALKDHGIARILGEKTFGKGTVQEFTTYIDGSSLKLTVAEWLTPLENSIEKNGITPDILVPLTAEDKIAGRDTQMLRALQELRNP